MIRRCNWCGAELDPIDWCDVCQKGNCDVHKKPRKRADAKYCSPYCNNRDRSTLKAILKDQKMGQ